MSLIDSVRTCLRKYGTFTGRARAAEYWLFYLALAIVNVVIFVALLLPALITMDPVTQEPGVLGMIGSTLLAIVMLGTLVPLLAAAVRRLHDTGKSGWFYLLCLVPFVGGIILIVLLALPGEPGPNRFGPDPKAVPQLVAA
ncbi:DUF805 domain-containing protein [Promicromonospora alba]|jgi:uncharacterized membrane protein YhaH (DUF805 family)|uniref:DUF805 domain-containing protein n=1 Tax=Promicromonospora alba TaxID=1616110 RepID=A0ABV9HD44_9MICO